MMRVLICFFLLFTVIGLNAQTHTIKGNYYLKWECDSHQIEYKLALTDTGTYELNTYTKDLSDPSDVIHNVEEGTWSAVDQVLSFVSDTKKDFDEEYTVDLNGSIARFILETPKDNTGKEHRTVLIFDTSKIYCIEGMEFVRME